MYYVLRTFSAIASSLVAQTLKSLPAMQETWVQTPGQKDFLEKGMTIHSSILAWRIPWTEQLDGLQSMKSQRVGHDWATNTFTLSAIYDYPLLNSHNLSNISYFFPFHSWINWGTQRLYKLLGTTEVAVTNYRLYAQALWNGGLNS